MTILKTAPPIGRQAAPRRSPARFWGLLLILGTSLAWGVARFAGFSSSVALISVASFVLAVVGLWRPPLGLLSVGVLCTIDPLLRTYLLTGGLFRWNTLNYFLILVAVLFLPTLVAARDAPTRLLEALLLVLAVGLAYSAGVKEGIQHMVGATAYFGLRVYVDRARGTASIWFWLAVVSGFVGAGAGLAYNLEPAQVQEIINPNAWVFCPLTFLFLGCIALWAEPVSTGRQFILGALAMVNLAWIFLSGSRGGLLIGLVCLAFMATRPSARSLRVMIAAGVALVGSVLTTLFAAQQGNSLHRIDKMFDSNYSWSGRTSGRYDLARGGWEIFLDHPLTGVGTGGFSKSWAQLRDVEGLSTFRLGLESEAHAGWVKTLSENGIPGILLHVAFVGSFAFLGWKGRRRGGLPFGVVVSAILAAAFVSTEFQGKALWLEAAIAASLLSRPPRWRAGSAVNRARSSSGERPGRGVRLVASR